MPIAAPPGPKKNAASVTRRLPAPASSRALLGGPCRAGLGIPLVTADRSLGAALAPAYNRDGFPDHNRYRSGLPPMSRQGSVTRWLGPLQVGDPAAAQQLWERYFDRLVGLARTKLRGAPRRAADEEDVALSAFDSFCRNAEQGRFPQLADRDSLWRLLVTLTVRKAAHQVRDEGRQKRGGAAALNDPDADLAEALSQEPSPEFAASVAEECQRLLNRLGDRELQTVALLRMEGYTVEELVEKLGCAPRSVKRKLALIRRIWEKEMAP
jgi:DNA-directed RNA polymerase specialized sigma24 family protein